MFLFVNSGNPSIPTGYYARHKGCPSGSGKAGKRSCTVVMRHRQGWDRVQRLMTEDRQGDWWNRVAQARGGCRAPSAPGTMLFLSLPLAHFYPVLVNFVAAVRKQWQEKRRLLQV